MFGLNKFLFLSLCISIPNPANVKATNKHLPFSEKLGVNAATSQVSLQPCLLPSSNLRHFPQRRMQEVVAPGEKLDPCLPFNSSGGCRCLLSLMPLKALRSKGCVFCSVFKHGPTCLCCGEG